MRRKMHKEKQKHPQTGYKKISPVFNRKQGDYLREASVATEKRECSSDETITSNSYKLWLADSYNQYHVYHPSCFSKYRWRKNSRSWKDQTRLNKQ